VIYETLSSLINWIRNQKVIEEEQLMICFIIRNRPKIAFQTNIVQKEYLSIVDQPAKAATGCATGCS
jgi:hypothetical protein